MNAKWIKKLFLWQQPKYYSNYFCSNCNYNAPELPEDFEIIGGEGAELVGAYFEETDFKPILSNYCPHCGAKMEVDLAEESEEE